MIRTAPRRLVPIALATALVVPSTEQAGAMTQTGPMTQTGHGEDATAPKHTNRLVDETSPYLLQHAHNPVDWYPWGPEAIERARSEEKPIFLSIGYSACHWCHVMERESFENEEIAAVMNEHFVCIKVDREERPDIDEIYMKAVQALTGSGGWPMSVWLTPDLEPFHGGTYFPPTRRFGRPGFTEVLLGVSEAWEKEREQIVAQGQRLTEHIDRENQQDTSGELADGVLDQSLQTLSSRYDAEWGGFGQAPKFPHSMDLRILLRHWLRTGDANALEMAVTTLDRMAEGGMYDHLAGGFHRYSTDEKWLIPHFEKMLYDNALLVPAYLEAYTATGEERHALVARECLDWVLTDMVTPQGAFASTLDADTEGEEGKFYVWTPDELNAVLGEELGRKAAEWWDVTEEGNFEHGTSALWRHTPAQAVAEELGIELADLEADIRIAREKLLVARAQRVHPGKDDKVLAAWNGLMASAFCHGYQALGEPRYLDAARSAIEYVLTGMRQEDGRLYATARAGRAQLNAYLDDYAFVTQALLDLYESDFDERWLREAIAFTDLVRDRFEDPKEGGFFTTGKGHEKLIARLKNPQDGALPSGNAVHALNLLRLGELTGDVELAKSADRTVRAFGAMINRFPVAFSQFLMAYDYVHAEPREIVIAGERGTAAVDAMLAHVRGRFLPQRVVVLADADADRELLPLTKERSAPAGSARAFVCRNYACKLPVDDIEGLSAQLSD